MREIWFCVEAGAAPISSGCRLPWKTMKRRIQWT
jgi:hypothetical protein